MCPAGLLTVFQKLSSRHLQQRRLILGLLPSHPSSAHPTPQHQFSSIRSSLQLPVRCSSTSRPHPSHPRPLLLAGLLLGISTSAWFIYRSFLPEAPYPNSILRILRQALYAERGADHDQAESLFREAYALTKQNVGSRIEGVEVDWTKASGIAIRWAAMLENIGRLDHAIELYEQVYSDLCQASAKSTSFDQPERLRAISLAQKLAELLSALERQPHRLEDEQRALRSRIERYLTWSVEEILRLINVSQRPSGDHPSSALEAFELPAWVEKADVGGCLEALGEFYAQSGNVDYALPLYLHALSVLLPPSDHKNRCAPTDQERCHAATLMNNIAQLLIQPPNPSLSPSPTGQRGPRLSDAIAWASKSLALAQSVLSKASNNPAVALPSELTECYLVRLVSRHNLASLAEKEGDYTKARRLFEEAKKDAEGLGAQPAVLLAKQGLERLSPQPMKD